jgi:S1-C subfamily serine protease
MAKNKPSHSISVNAERFLLPAAILLLGHAHAQQNLESAYRTTGPAVVAAFEPQRAVLQTSSAVLMDGRRESGYGVIVSDTGHILVKASEFAELKDPSVTVDRTNYPEIEKLAEDPAWDVALIKIDARDLVPVVYAPTSAVPQGTWVVTNGATSRSKRRLLAGIISAKIREIPAAGGAALGIVLDAKADGLVIDEVNEKSGAKDAGLEKGDVILRIEDKPVEKVADIAKILKDRKAGSIVKLTYKRGDVEATIEVRLAARGEMFTEQMNRNDMMSGDFSKRRSGFPRILQHDIFGSSRFVGGPLLDLEGRCIGMNIARANRAESFAIPVEDLREIADRLIGQKQSGPDETPAEPAESAPAEPQTVQ